MNMYWERLASASDTGALLPLAAIDEYALVDLTVFAERDWWRIRRMGTCVGVKVYFQGGYVVVRM